jgi:ABC-type branched-subunit amino acid transport system substrate-binding protein
MKRTTADRMTRRAAFSLLAAPCLSALQPPPYIPPRERIAGYNGEGRDVPEPGDLNEVRLGWFAPSDPAHPAGGALWAGASLALEDANAKGGYKNRPFAFVPRWSDDPWRSGASSVVRMIYTEKVWAILGSLEGAATHLAEQVVAKALTPLIDPISTDRSVNYANVPWMFSCAPSDAAIAACLSSALKTGNAARRVALFFTTDHDSRTSAADFEKSLSPASRQQVSPGHPELEASVNSLPADATAAMIFAGAADSARWLKAIRATRPSLPVCCGTSAGTAQFAAHAGSASDGVVAPILYEPSPRVAAFDARLRSRSGKPADYLALHAYDAVNLTVQAIREAGLNRALIRDWLASRQSSSEPWTGVSGTIRWDANGRNRRPAFAGVWSGGRLTPIGGSAASLSWTTDPNHLWRGLADGAVPPRAIGRTNL